MRHHPLLHLVEHHQKKPTGRIRWPSFRGSAVSVGASVSGLVHVYYDPMTGSAGLKNATDLKQDSDRIVAGNNAIFGIKQIVPVNVVVFAIGGATDGSGGADHMACDFPQGGNIEVCASFDDSMRCSALFEAELSECAMNNTLCGLSTGEALSRWASMVLSNNALSDFATAPEWADQRFPNFVDHVDPTDQNGVSIGCGMAFISWVLHKGKTLSSVARDMVSLGDQGTLAAMAANFLGMKEMDVWSAFLADCSAVQITSDDPFGGMPVIA